MKKFKEFTSLLETPMMNNYWTKDKMSVLSDTAKQNIKDSTYPEEKVGHDFYHKIVNGDHAYFNKNNDGEVNAFSLVTKDNIHKLTHKNTGTAQQIHSFMIHHAKQHGSIKTDMTNTEGSKHLWTSLVKSSPPNKKFHYENLVTNEKVPVDTNNIDTVSDKIWGRHSKFNDVKLVMTHHDSA
jgi:hypothetical protein